MLFCLLMIPCEVKIPFQCRTKIIITASVLKDVYNVYVVDHMIYYLCNKEMLYWSVRSVNRGQIQYKILFNHLNDTMYLFQH